MASDRPQTGSGANPRGVTPDTSTLVTQLNGATSWFLWLAGLSVLNGVITAFGGQWTFLFGLGITQVVDGFISGVVHEIGADSVATLRFVNLGVDVIIAGLFAMCGILGRERRIGVYIGGLAFYLLDAVLVLVFRAWLEVGFHALVLGVLWRGLQVLRELRAVESSGIGERAIS